MSNRNLLLVGTISNIIIAAGTYAVLGWNSASAHAAARNTARGALFFFVLGFAQPGLFRVISQLPSAAGLVQSFVCAQLVHFVTVIITVALDNTHFLRHFSFQGTMVVLVGSTIVLGAGLTAGRSSSRLMNVLHQLFLYLVFIIYFTDYLEHPIKPLRVMAFFLAAALVIRLVGHLYRPKAMAKAVASVGR